METADPRRTYHASQAVHMSDLLNLRFAKERFGTERPRYLRIREPDGPSTDGGRVARQAITLVDFQEDAKSTIVCGFLDTVAKKAELRGFAMVNTAFEQRFGGAVDISRGEYARMMSMLQDFMAGQGIETRMINEPPPRAASIRASSQMSSAPVAPTTAIIEPPEPAATWSPMATAFLAGFAVCYMLVKLGYL